MRPGSQATAARYRNWMSSGMYSNTLQNSAARTVCRYLHGSAQQLANRRAQVFGKPDRVRAAARRGMDIGR
jgi:hypothetical protein